MPLSSHNTHRASPLPFLDPKAIRQHLRKLIRHQEHLHQRDTPHYTHMVIREIWQLVQEASRQLQAGKHPQALLILQAITDVCTKQWMYLNDIHSEVSTFFQELARIWTEALLTVDLTPQERTRWTRQMTSWQARLGDWSVRAAFDAHKRPCVKDGRHPHSNASSREHRSNRVLRTVSLLYIRRCSLAPGSPCSSNGNSLSTICLWQKQQA